ncbi:MAG: tetratricopeptide repeat protein [Candidatus Edwardsbacteria bacterium]|nr:tetratricopeptide repeat protein [Candidatus Edwardsbacteria bacterium]MBU1577285.1 tetratricopeptide repeat protein [Candidatus Edwardsbacteria bacterium]MBU2462834.1 tetratricopeptide repeat protein [Candidatus Edwardsbacteria bacterium]MBU2594886.1 tetratricopeptide repeat protein [Candidatus Edwardsbacteria bacterium]
MDNKSYTNKWKPIIIGVLFLLIWFGASFFNGRFTWGFDYLQYYPLWFRLGWVLAGMSALLSLGFWVPGLLIINDRFENRKLWNLVLLVAVMGGLFWLLRQAIPLLGDGFLRVREITGGRIFSLTEPLTTMVHGLLFNILSGNVSDAPAATRAYVVISILSGLAMVWLYHRISTRWFENSYWLATALLLGLGFNQIFFGYVESYAPFMLAVLAFAWLGARSLEDEGGALPLVLLFGLIVALHAKGIFLLPALVYLLAAKWPEVRQRLWWVVPLSAALPLAVVLAGRWLSPDIHWEASLGEIPKNPLLPLWDGMRGYGILSPGHWMDILNQYLLTIPGIIFLFSALLIERARVKLDRTIIFLSLLAISGLAFIVITDPKLGAARDWDLFAWVGIPAAVLGLHLMKQKENNKKILMVGGFLSLWLLLPWVLLNASLDLSIERYLKILGQDEKSSAYGYENLAIYYRQAKLKDKAEWAYKQAVENAPHNPRMLYNYGTILVQNSRPTEGAEYFKRALVLNPNVYFYWNDYGSVMLRLGQYPLAREALERSVRLNDSSPDAWYNLGIACSIQQEWARADTAFLRAAANGFSGDWIYAYWGEVQLNLGQYPSAVKNLKQAIDAGITDSLTIDSYHKARAGMEAGMK